MNQRPGQATIPPAERHAQYAALKAEVEACFRAGRPDDAERALGEIVRLNPREHVAWSLLAKAALQRGDAALALGHIGHALEGARRHPGYLNLQAVAQAESGALDAAEATLQEGVERAFEAIASGEARAKLDAFVKFTQQFGKA